MKLTSTRSESGSPTISSLQQIGDTQNHDTFNHNRNSFNVIHNHKHYYNQPHDRYYRSRNSPFTPSLASVASEDSSTTKSPHSPISDGITQVEGSHDSATQMPIALKSNRFPHASASLDGITTEDRNIHQDYEQSVSSNFGASSRQSSVSRVTHPGSVKTRSLRSSVKNLSGRLKSLLSKNQLPEKLDMWTDCNINDVDNYIPEGMDKKLKNYMRSRHLGPKNVIPLWNPSPTQGVNVRRRVRLDVGDLGTFTRRGGFRVAFNILMSDKTNKLCDYDLPKNFSPFDSRLTSEQLRSCSVKDDGVVINLDGCGAIVQEKTSCSGGALLYGFSKNRCESSEPSTTRYNISPMAVKDKRRGYIHLPCSQMIYSLKSYAAKDLQAYLKKNLSDPDWLDYLDDLWDREKAPPIIITSVWAARNFACATYTVHPPNTSAVAQILTSSKEDKMYWTQVPEGFVTACAPLDDGYDGDGKLKSQVEDQCFAIEGKVLKSRKEFSKRHASLVTV